MKQGLKELSDRFMEITGVPVQLFLLKFSKLTFFDVDKYLQWAVTQGYVNEDDTSLREWTEKKYGQEVVSIIEKLMKGIKEDNNVLICIKGGRNENSV